MNTNKLLATIVAILTVGGFAFSASMALADDQRQPEQQFESQKNGAGDVKDAQKENNQHEEMDNASSSDRGEEYENSTSTNSNENDLDEGDRHRSAVALFVHNLDRIASSSSNGIGEKVREVAKEQNDSKDKTSESLKSLESRGAFIKFLIGANHDSLLALEESASTTQNHIDALNQLKTGAPPEIQKALADQVIILTKEKERIEAMIDANKNSTGIFGWLIRLFQ